MVDGDTDWISAQEWAERAGVSVQQARRLASAGKVPARRLGRAWAIHASAARRRPNRHGRPLSARSAWATIAVLDGREPDGASRSERLRARERARHADQLEPGWLSGRATLRDFHAHPGVLERLDADPRLVIGGARAASHHGADIIALDDREFYARQSDVHGLVRRYGLRDALDDQANVKIRILDGQPPSSGRYVSAATAAIDLLDAGDERSTRTARRMLASMSQGESAR